MLGTTKGEPIRFVPGHGNFQKRGKPYKRTRYQIKNMGYATPCWLWFLAKSQKGYGIVWDPARGRMIAPHILAYESRYGAVPEGLEIDHLCAQRTCINPEHLEAVTHAENVARGARRGAYQIGSFNARKTHCPNGHPYDNENTYLERTRGGFTRRCHICRTEQREVRKQTRRKTIAT